MFQVVLIENPSRDSFSLACVCEAGEGSAIWSGAVFSSTSSGLVLRRSSARAVADHASAHTNAISQRHRGGRTSVRVARRTPALNDFHGSGGGPLGGRAAAMYRIRSAGSGSVTVRPAGAT